MSEHRGEQTKPQPAPGMICRHVNATPTTAPFVVFDVTDTHVQFDSDKGARMVRRDWEWYEVIGLVTPHGRVMVGERRHAPYEDVLYGPVMVTRVVVGTFVGILDPVRGEEMYGADLVASWALISPPTPAEPQTWDTVTIGGVSYPAKEIRYEAEGGEEAASTRVILGTRGNVAFTMTLAPEEVANARRLSNMTDPREQGPGISRLPPPEVRPDVVVTAAWEDRWTTP